MLHEINYVFCLKYTQNDSLRFDRDTTRDSFMIINSSLGTYAFKRNNSTSHIFNTTLVTNIT